MASTALPEIIFGAGGIGTTKTSWTYTWDTPEKASKLLDLLKDLGFTHLDSAASYPPGNPWNTETLMGQADVAQKGFVIDSKVAAYPEVRRISLTEGNIEFSIDKTLRLLGIDQVNTLYSHGPNPETPLEETARGFDKQYRAGKFKQLGMSNFNYDQMKELLDICETKGYVKPKVYQGHYNALWRTDEEKLYPLLREHGIKIYAYSPLGGGFLTGKVTFDNEEAAGSEANKTATANVPKLHSRNRWKGEAAFKPYADAYGKESIHTAIRKLQDTLQTVPEAKGMSLTEASLRWILHHSYLKEGDGIIIGATRESQIIANMEAFRNGPLPESIRKAVDELWVVSSREGLNNSMWTKPDPIKAKV